MNVNFTDPISTMRIRPALMLRRPPGRIARSAPIAATEPRCGGCGMAERPDVGLLMSFDPERARTSSGRAPPLPPSRVS
jgi:hypothetical protein